MCERMYEWSQGPRLANPSATDRDGAAGVTQVMPYYGMPVGTEWDEVGFAFNRPVVQGLLRDHYRFDGIVCTDWFLLEATDVAGHAFGPNCYGLVHLTPKERLRGALEAGVDQLAGDSCTHLLIELVEDGVVPESRIDQSARRLLREKFRLGLFERRRVDGAQARAVVGPPSTAPVASRRNSRPSYC